MKSFVVNFSLVFCGLAVALGVLEGALRIAASVNSTDSRQSLSEQLQGSEREGLSAGCGPGGSADCGDIKLGGLIKPSSLPDVVYELKPGLQGSFVRRPLSINAAGMRDSAYALEKPAGVKRIVGIGDSVMFGWGVDEHESYLSLIERELAAGKSGQGKYEVLNFAVPGYNTTMEVAAFEKRAQYFEPDLVVLHFVNNDFSVPQFMQRSEDFSGSYLLRFLNSRLGPIFGRAGGHHGLETFAQNRDREALQHYIYMTGPSGFLNAAEKLASLTTAHGVPVILLYGRLFSGQKRVIKTAAQEFGFNLVAVKPFVDEYIKQHGESLGIKDDSESRARALTISPQDPHPNALGHKIYAAALMQKLRAIGFIG